MKLKTLKDLAEIYKNSCNCYEENGKTQSMTELFKEDLKQELIKWYKKWGSLMGGQAVRDFIKHFSNLNPEDLR